MEENPKDDIVSASDDITPDAPDEENQPVNSTTASSSATRQLSTDYLPNIRQIATQLTYPTNRLELTTLEKIFKNEVNCIKRLLVLRVFNVYFDILAITSFS